MEEQEVNNFLIEQCKQASETDRHYDRMAWMIGTVLMPVALGVLAITVNAFRYLSFWEVLILELVSVIMLCAWGVMFARMCYWQGLCSHPLIKSIECHFNSEHFFKEKAPEVRRLWRLGR